MNRDLLHLSLWVRRPRHAKSYNDPDSFTRFTTVKEEIRLKSNMAKNFHFQVELPNLVRNNPWKFWHSVLPGMSSSTSFMLNDEIISEPSTFLMHLILTIILFLHVTTQTFPPLAVLLALLPMFQSAQRVYLNCHENIASTTDAWCALMLSGDRTTFFPYRLTRSLFPPLHHITP